MSSFDLDDLQGDGDNPNSPPPQTPASNETAQSATMPPTKPQPSPLWDEFSSARPMNLNHRVNMAGASAEQSKQGERSSPNVPPSTKNPTRSPDETGLAALVPLPSGTSFLQAQRLEAPTSTVSETTMRLIESIYSTDVFEYTDTNLLTWFRKHTLVAEGEVPFFSTVTLAKLMLKENSELKSYISTFKAKINHLTGIHRMSALVALTETIFTHYQPSSPTIIKLSIHFLTNTEGLSDDAFNGLDSTASILSLTTDFITNYYQVEDHNLRKFDAEEIIAGKLISRPSLNGSFNTQPGYLRLCADRTVFTNAEEITKYFDTWSNLWRMLKTCLCAGVQFVPDVDLAIRRRIINGSKTHPLRQQFTIHGPEPARLWLGRYHKADEAGLVFQNQAGFDCGLSFDDVGHISIGMDAIHDCLLDLFGLILMQQNIGTVKVPRVLPELRIFEPNRRLPDCTWPQFITVFTQAEHLFENSLTKKTWPVTRPLAIKSNLLSIDPSGPSSDGTREKKCKYCKGAHWTSDCPSPERASAEVCRQHLAGKCRNGMKNCKYLHPSKSESHLTNSGGESGIPDSQDSDNQKSKNSQKKSPKVEKPSGSLVADGRDGQQHRPKPPPDDFTKAQTRTCSIPECARRFTIPLDGDKGTLWYQDKGLFLPKRCQECIAAGKTTWKPKPTESQLSQSDQSANDPTADPDSVDSLFADFSGVSDHDCLLDLLDPTASVDQLALVSDPAVAQPESPATGNNGSPMDYFFPLPSLSTRVMPITTSLMADRLTNSARLQQLTGHRRRTISENDIHDCLLELWGGLPVAPDAFDAARRSIHEYMVTGHWTQSGEILMWGGEPIAISATEPAAVFSSLCRQCTSTGLDDSCIELCHGFVEAIHRLSQDGAMAHMDLGDTDDSESALSSQDTSESSACSDSDTEWLRRVSQKYGALQGPLPAPSAAENSGNRYPTRARANPVRFQPSPSGLVQDCVSPGEYFSAVVDPNLSDVSIASTDDADNESTSDSENSLNTSFGASLASIVCIAVLCLGHVLGDEQLTYFLPHAQVGPNEDPHAAADRLAASLYLSDHLIVPINNTALEDGTVIRTYALNLGSREYDLQPILQQVRELMDRQSIIWYSQTQVNADSLFGYSEIGPLTDVLNEAFAEVTHQNLITGVGHMSIASNSLLSVCSSDNVAYSDSSTPSLHPISDSDSQSTHSSLPVLEAADHANAIDQQYVGNAYMQGLPYSSSDISTAYHQVEIDAVVLDEHAAVLNAPHWFFPAHDQIPPDLNPGDYGFWPDSSTDEYSSYEGEWTDGSDSASIPIHARYAMDSDFGDTASTSSLLEPWNAQFSPATQGDPAPRTDPDGTGPMYPGDEQWLAVFGSHAIPSTDGRGETLEQLDAPCPWIAETPPEPPSNTSQPAPLDRQPDHMDQHTAFTAREFNAQYRLLRQAHLRKLMHAVYRLRKVVRLSTFLQTWRLHLPWYPAHALYLASLAPRISDHRHQQPPSTYRQRYWSINSLHRVLQSDTAPALHDVCVWLVRRWALRADVYFNRYIAQHSTDCVASTADGLSVMPTFCNWLFRNSVQYYLSHPAAMGWVVGRQMWDKWTHYDFFSKDVLRRLTTTAAICIRDIFHCRPIDNTPWYYHRDNWAVSTNQITTVDLGNDTDGDTICAQSGADAEGNAVSRCWLRRVYHYLVVRWFKVWALTTPTCSAEAVTTKVTDDDEPDDDIPLWPEYLPRQPSTNGSEASTKASSRQNSQPRNDNAAAQQDGQAVITRATDDGEPYDDGQPRNNDAPTQQDGRRITLSADPTADPDAADPTADPDAVDSLPADHRNDHLHKLCPCDTHSLLTASNSNREFLAHAVFLDDSSGPTEPPCDSVLQICALWDSGSNTCLITPNNVKPHWHWVSRKAQNVAGVGGKITQSKGIVIAPVKLVHSGVVKLVCCTVIDFHKVIDILFGLDFQFTHSCVFDPSNFRVYDRLAKEAIRLDYIGKVKARLAAAPIHFLSLCDGIATPYGMALNMGFKVAKYFAFEKSELCRSVAKSHLPRHRPPRSPRFSPRH